MTDDTAPAWDGRAAEPGDWHWLGCGDAPPFPWRWLPATADDPVDAWGNGDGRELTVAGAAKGWRYYGPCLTRSEATAREAAASAAALLMAERACNSHGDTLARSGLPVSAISVARTCAVIVGTQPGDTTALDRLLAEAREEEREACAKLARRMIGPGFGEHVEQAIRARSTPA